MTCIIFEGPDGAGKTTLAQAWQRHLEGRHHATVVPVNHGPYVGEQDIAHHYVKSLLMARTGDTIMMDRSWISEAAYGPVARGANRIDVPRLRALERLALGVGARVVVCLPPYETCRTAYMARKHLEYLADETQLRAVWDWFKMYCTAQLFPHNRGPLRTNFYSWTDEPHRRTFIELLEQESITPNIGPGVGHFHPGKVTLMVGDQVNVNTAAAPLPFISWHPGGCAGWLSLQLEEWHVSEDQLYWINANDLAGRYTAADGWLDALRPKKIVALGTVASEWCHHYNLSHIAVPHPQHHKRFHHDEPYILQEVLT